MAPTAPSKPRFRHGRVVLQSNVTDLIEHGKLDLQPYLQRHLNGDWGDVGEAVAFANESALRNKDFLFSSYNLTRALKLMIVTDDDRRTTTVLLIRRYRLHS